jgi:rhodanese-related sulfurtransferase
MLRGISAFVVISALSAQSVFAQEVNIAPGLAEISVDLNGQALIINRNQDQAAVLSGDYALTSRACPPNCIQPMSAGVGVETYGELEVLGFLQGQVAQGRGVLIDSRFPGAFGAGHLPGAVNVPTATLAPENEYRGELLKALGAEVLGDGALEYKSALEVVVYCDGPWSDQALLVVSYLIEAGYPAEKLKFYRGGMQDWLHLGLTIAAPGN